MRRLHSSIRSLCPAFLAVLILGIGSVSAANKATVNDQGTISQTICDGEPAELVCPAGKVISIVLGNYGRFSVTVCLPDNDVIPTNNNCQNHKTKSILEKKCNNRSTCYFVVNNSTFTEDPCPSTNKYLEVNYQCVEAATTTPTTTTSAMTTSDHSLIEGGEEEQSEKNSQYSAVTVPRKKVDLICPATNRRGVNWQNTKAGSTSSAPCPEGSNGKQVWVCSEDGHWATEHPNSAGCQSDWVSQRNSQLTTAINQNDPTGLPETFRLMGADTRRPMVGGDLQSVLQFIERTVEVITEEKWAAQHMSLVNKGIVEVMNYVMRNQEIWESYDARDRKRFATRYIAATEKMMATAAPVMAKLTDVNVIVQPSITTEVSHKISLKGPKTDFIVFPSAAVWSGQHVDSADIPNEAFQKASDTDTQVFFSSYDNLGSYMTPNDLMVVPSGSDEAVTRKRRVVSRLVGVTLIVNGKEVKVDKLKKPVRIKFYHKETAVRHMDSATCVWWDLQKMDWSPSGCTLDSHNKTMTICSCDHLTHFAVLMDVHGHDLDETDATLLTLLTYIGCFVSIVCLLLTLFAYMIFSRNGGDRVFIHQNLCLSLAIAEITFLVGIARTEDSVQCGIIAAVLMYMFLCALTWMLLEGYHIHRMLTEVFPSDPRRFSYLLIGYITPAIFTLIAYLYNSDGFGTKEHCWLSTHDNFIWFFAAPAAFILCANTLVLVKTLCTVYQHTSGGYLPCRHDVDSGRSIRSWVKGSLALACLLGVTWLLGLFWLKDSQSNLMAYAFTVINSLQGLFIFSFHVVFAEKMRKDVAHWMYRRGCGGSSDSSPKRHQRDLMSPGLNSSTGSEFLYNTNDKYLNNSDTTNQLMYNNRGMPHPNQISTYQHHPHHQIYEQQPGTYDYATIAYGDMLPGQMNRMAAPPAYQRMMADGRYVSQQQLYQAWHHRPPPEFSPPPPPPMAPANARHYGTGSSGRRPPSSKMSDDSAYSDGGSSSMLTTEVTPQGQTVLRIDLNKPNMYCQDL